MKTVKIMILISVFFLAIAPAGPVHPNEAGRVLSVKRDVFLLRDGGKEDARPQSPLLLKDAVETSIQSRTKLFFHDDSILNLGEQSRVVVEEYLQSATGERSKSVYRLLEGSLKVVVGNSDLEIHTPTAVAAARGTVFIMWLQGVGEFLSTGILVLEGEVLLRNILDSVKRIQRIQSGQMTNIPMGKSPEPPVPAPPEVIASHDQNTSAIGSVYEKEEDGLPDPPSPGSALSARALQDKIHQLGVPPISQQPAEGGNLVVRIEFPIQ